ncbi:hypothetical protein [Natronorubrum sp. A-ect3]|uniref:hypothetical protein n=1 Tax=Natronorubrum sp. A-ect3 TaxID=3242698 RepID=UPI00359CDEFA
METRIRVTDEDGKETEITGVNRNDWDGLSESCPECGSDEFDHFEVTGGHYGKQGKAIIERTDYWSAKQSLFTQCKSCGEVLYKHPAFDLLFDLDGDSDTVFEM